MSTRQELAVKSSVQQATFEKVADLAWSAINEIEVTQWCYDPLPGNAIKTKPQPNMDQYWIIPIDMSEVVKWDRITEKMGSNHRNREVLPYYHHGLYRSKGILE